MSDRSRNDGLIENPNVPSALVPLAPPASQTDFADLTPCPGCRGSGEFRSCIDGECAHANLGCPDCAQTCPLCGGMGRV